MDREQDQRQPSDSKQQAWISHCEHAMRGAVGKLCMCREKCIFMREVQLDTRWKMCNRPNTFPLDEADRCTHPASEE